MKNGLLLLLITNKVKQCKEALKLYPCLQKIVVQRAHDGGVVASMLYLH